MDRQIIYPGQIPLETDLLNTNKNTMVALGKLIAAVFGTSTFVSGLACVPTGPASLNVQVNPGEIYSLQNIDGTAYSSLAADTTHQIMKQGIMLDAVTLACAAPATAGQSINYLIQATYQDSDTELVALPYYNASNPAQAWSGPNNSGTQQATARKGVVTISAKAGIAAATGTQTTPAPDAGYVGLWVVTVANGQTQITAPNITQAVGSPFFGQAALLNVANAFALSPTAPTPPAGDSSGKLATTEFVTGRLLNVQVFTANGTYTPTPGMKTAIVEVQAGGGASGGIQATASNQSGVSGNGAPGSYAKARLTAAQIGASVAVSVGAGGVAAVAGANAGGNGATSSFGALVTCPGGGGGGSGNISTTYTNAAGGNAAAAPSGTGIVFSSYGVVPPNSGQFGIGYATALQTSPSVMGRYGAGAQGRYLHTSQPAIGGIAGEPGIVIVWEFA